METATHMCSCLCTHTHTHKHAHTHTHTHTHMHMHTHAHTHIHTHTHRVVSSLCFYDVRFIYQWCQEHFQVYLSVMSGALSALTDRPSYPRNVFKVTAIFCICQFSVAMGIFQWHRKKHLYNSWKLKKLERSEANQAIAPFRQERENFSFVVNSPHLNTNMREK